MVVQNVSRRGFIRLTGGAVALGVVQACAPTPAGVPAGGASGGTAKPGASTGGAVAMPAYVPFQGPKPDFPASADGIVPPGYLTFPKDKLVKSVSGAVGKGEDVDFFTYSINPPPPPLHENSAWQLMNKEIGVNLRFDTVALQDWDAKLATLLASGTIPDMMTIEVLDRLIPNELEFLNRQCADLTPFVGGDAVKAYPNLANFPTTAWKNTVKGGRIWALPRLTNSVGTTLIVKQNWMDDFGIKEFKNKEDFVKFLQDVTKSGRGYGIGGIQALNMSWPAGVLRAPNNWKLENGKLIKNYETPEYKEAVAFMRQLWDLGVVSPDTPTFSQNSGAQAFYASKFAMYPTSYFAFTIAWNRLLGIDKEFRMSAINPFGHDGGKGYVFQSWGGNQVAVLRKADPDRVKLLLGVLNYLAAPFGTQEDLNRTYGVEGTHFTYDDKGNPVRTDRGRQEVEYMAWGTIISPPPVLYNSADSQAVAAGHPLMVAAHDQAITDPTIGLFSNAYANKGATLTQGVVDGVNEIIFGRAPVSTFDDLVKKWKADGGDTIRGEFEAELAKA